MDDLELRREERDLRTGMPEREPLAYATYTMNGYLEIWGVTKEQAEAKLREWEQKVNELDLIGCNVVFAIESSEAEES